MSHCESAVLRYAALVGATVAMVLTGCAAARPALKPDMPALALEETSDRAPQPPPPPVLTENHFATDRTSGLSEDALRTVLAAPVFLEEKARVGVVPVVSRYEPDEEVPLSGATAVLADALEGSGEFELATEVSTDFPAQSGISGLRELAARYRSDYLLIYRQRFVSRDYLNGSAWGYITGIGALFLPGNTIESAGVLEATLFDVKTGTILFTVEERTAGADQVNNWHEDLKMQWLQKRLLEDASQKLAKQVLAKVHRLAVARVTYEEEAAKRVVSSPRPPDSTSAPEATPMTMRNPLSVPSEIPVNVAVGASSK